MKLGSRRPATDGNLKPWLAAVGGGVLWALCFGRNAHLLLPGIALWPLLWLLDQPRAWRWALLHGLVSWCVAIPWIVPTLITFGAVPAWLAACLLGLLSLYLGAFHALFAQLGRRLWHHPWLALFGLPGLWVALEWLRGWLFGGFPWNLAGYAWVDLPGVLPLCAWVGAWGVSFLLVACNVAMALAVRQRSFVLAAAGMLVIAVILPVAGRFSTVDPHAFRQPGREARILQPNLPIVREVMAGDNYRQLLAQSSAECPLPAPGLAAAERRLLLWPESAAWPMAYDSSQTLRADIARLDQGGCDLLLNTPTFADDSIFNSAVLITDGELAGRYHKRHLVPWGEYVPLQQVLPFLGKLARQVGSFSPGVDAGLLPWAGEKIGLSICYEITYPAAVAAQVRAGATVLVTVTNDAWYGDSSAPWQHFRAARFRAAENRRPLLRAALTGVSGALDARGAVLSQLGVGERGVLAVRVAGLSELTRFSRAPWLVPLLSALLAVLALVFARASLL